MRSRNGWRASLARLDQLPRKESIKDARHTELQSSGQSSGDTAYFQNPLAVFAH